LLPGTAAQWARDENDHFMPAHGISFPKIASLEELGIMIVHPRSMSLVESLTYPHIVFLTIGDWSILSPGVFWKMVVWLFVVLGMPNPLRLIVRECISQFHHNHTSYVTCLFGKLIG